MYGNDLKSLTAIRCVALTLFLCCIQTTSMAADNTSLSKAMAMSEKQLFSHVMNIDIADFIAIETTNSEIKMTEEEIALNQKAWDQLLHVRGVEADQYVLKMLYYYLGESTGSAVHTSLQCRRGRILADLRRIKKRGVQCEPAYQKLCADKELWEVRVADINKIIANKNPVSQKYCNLKFYPPAVLEAPKKRK
jgi:hypothetical protein